MMAGQYRRDTKKIAWKYLKNSLKRNNGIITRAKKDKCKRKPSKMQERGREREGMGRLRCCSRRGQTELGEKSEACQRMTSQTRIIPRECRYLEMAMIPL